MLAGAVSIYFAGRIYDRKQSKSLFLSSSAVVSITWIGRFFSTTVLGFVLSDIVNRVFDTVVVP